MNLKTKKKKIKNHPQDKKSVVVSNDTATDFIYYLCFGRGLPFVVAPVFLSLD